VVQGLVHDLNAIRPDLVVVSGDITQRARASQFVEARAFLQQLNAPRLVVPGNHDVTPIFRPLRRAREPFQEYKKHISEELSPSFLDEELAVIGVNTAHPHHLSEGRVSARELDSLTQRLMQVGDDRFKIVVTHHPFIPHPKWYWTPLVYRAARTLSRLENCHVDLLLAGHLHHGFTGDVIAHHSGITRSILVAQASTSTSTRLRTDPNAYNLLSIERGRVTLRVRAWTGDEFVDSRSESFTKQDGLWARLP
jgi:3',5'-cyclic AMP phosphodiesterase CpdA